MTLDEAITEFESSFTVHPEIGCPNADYEGPRDMSKAPTGEQYQTVTSWGRLRDGDQPSAFFANVNDGRDEWLASARQYANGTSGKHLYWREKPRWVEAEFVPINQVAAANDDALRRCLHIKVGFIYSRFLVSTMDPSCKEDSE